MGLASGKESKGSQHSQLQTSRAKSGRKKIKTAGRALASKHVLQDPAGPSQSFYSVFVSVQRQQKAFLVLIGDCLFTSKVMAGMMFRMIY